MENNGNILSALKFLDVSAMSRAEWISVGMALKEEGYPCSVWDDWSRNDRRYHPGECDRKWNSFHGSGSPVKGGTIVQMAKERGWTVFHGDGCMNWDDAIEYDGDSFTGFTQVERTPTEDLITYLETIFMPDEKVGYVTNDVWQDAEGRWVPSTAISGVADVNEQMVLRYRYIHNMSWEVIGDEMCAGRATVIRWHDAAVGHFTVPENPISIFES